MFFFIYILFISIQVSFNVDYTFVDTSYLRDFQIAIGTLSTLGIIYAGYRTWVWSKRAGRLTIDFPTIANFFFFCAGSLSNVFFMVSFGMSFYWLIFFKVRFGPCCKITCLQGFANNKGADQPARMRSLISTFVIRLLESIIPRLATRGI